MCKFDGLRDAVARGAALLDDKDPGWAAKIDVARLAMRNSCACVIGQLFKRYREGLNALGLRDANEAAEHGFDLVLLDSLDAAVITALEALWVEQINARVAAMPTEINNHV